MILSHAASRSGLGGPLYGFVSKRLPWKRTSSYSNKSVKGAISFPLEIAVQKGVAAYNMLIIGLHNGNR